MVEESLVKQTELATEHSAEFDLLYQSSRTKIGGSGENAIRNLVRAQIDWPFFIRTAQHHRVVPLVYRSLTKACGELLPERVARDLRIRCQANVQRNLFLSAELLRVLDLFEQNHIQTIPYKGPVLAAALYGDCSLRQFSDIDVIVPGADVERARALLISRGYEPNEDLSNGGLHDLMHHEKHLIFRRNGVTLELHWSITVHPNPIEISPDFLWTNLRSVAMGGHAVKIHAPEDLLLILCIHGSKHRWEYLVWICDIAELIRTYPDLDWNRAVQNAARLRATRILFLGLVLARDLLGAELPQHISSAADGDRVLGELEEEVKHVLACGSSDADAPGELSRYFMKLREHRTDRLVVALSQAKHYLSVNARDKEVRPTSSAVVLYVVRPFRLIKEYGLRPFQRFFKGLLESWRE